MNRQMRRDAQRQAKRAARLDPALNHRKSRKPDAKGAQLVFGPVESFLNNLGTGWVNCADSGAPVFETFDGDLYQATPAIRGLVSAIERNNRHYQIEQDFEPVIKLCNKLDADMPISPDAVRVAKEIFAQAKRNYLMMDLDVVKSLVNTELISYEFEKRGLTA